MGSTKRQNAWQQPARRNEAKSRIMGCRNTTVFMLVLSSEALLSCVGWFPLPSPLFFRLYKLYKLESGYAVCTTPSD